ncbi:hypothetical protein BX661DRAFT_143730, partial [Kickxella alabastrina]|uniref:uncharacterized protein n=1 Tax=Kickxella alabastrina TaxID=61397 RepID=UPI002220EB43
EKTRQMGEECLGMAMVFSMASDLKEAAMQRLIEKSVELRRLKEERIQREIEADQLKFIGTPVTRATFLEWRIRFDREMKDHAARLRGRLRDTSKLTGRQLFEQDKSLALSDSRFISEGDVSVDAATFVKEENVAGLASE